MNKGIFRQTAMESRNDKWSGKSFLPRGVPLWWVSTGCLAFILTLLAFIVFGAYHRRVLVSGEMISEPRSVTVFSSHQGFIAQQFVNVGDQVIEGQPLYQLNTSKTTTSGVVSDTQKNSIKTQITTIDEIINKTKNNKAVTLSSLSQQVDNYNHILFQSRDTLKRAEQGLIFMEKNMENYRTYLSQGLVNKEQLVNQMSMYYQRQNDLLDLKNQVGQYELQVINLQANMKTQETDFDNQINQLIIQKSELQRQLADTDANGLIIISAPLSGRVESSSVTPGEMVNSGDSLLQIFPGSIRRYVLVLWVPGHATPYITPGDKVNIRYDAFPAEKFGQFPGRIIAISSVPASAQEMSTYPAAPVRTTDTPETWYKLLVVPDEKMIRYRNKTFEFSNGMKAKSVLFLEKRKLYQWILSPLYDVKNSTEGPVDDR